MNLLVSIVTGLVFVVYIALMGLVFIKQGFELK